LFDAYEAHLNLDDIASNDGYIGLEMLDPCL